MTPHPLALKSIIRVHPLMPPTVILRMDMEVKAILRRSAFVEPGNDDFHLPPVPHA